MKQYTQNYQGFEVRCVEDENNVIWFVTKDLLEALDINVSNVTNKVKSIPDEWKGSHQIATLGGTQQIQCLTEEDKFIHPILDGTNYVNQSLITESGSVYCWSLTERQG